MADRNHNAPPLSGARGPAEAAFAARFKTARAAARLTTKEVATGAGISMSAVQAYEAGRMLPRPEVLRRLEQVLGARLDDSAPPVAATGKAAGEGRDKFFSELAALCAKHGMDRGMVTVAMQIGA